MIRSENLRSGYILEDVENYLYDLLPKGDGVITEIEEYAAKNRVPIIGPASDRELFLDLPSGGLAMGGIAMPHIAESQPRVEREFLANNFLP